VSPARRWEDLLHSKSRLAALVVGATVAALAVCEAPARAEVGLSLPPVVDDAERGVRFGEFVFVPKLGVEGRYYNNLNRQDSREGRTDAGTVGINPGFRLDNPDATTFRLTWDADTSFRFFFSEDENAKSLGRIAAASTLKAEILPKSVFGLFIRDTFLREIQPRNYSSSQSYDRNFNHAEAGMTVRPGGGALQISASYAFNFDLFDSFKDGDIYFHQVRLLTTWDFFPKTTLFVDGDWRYTKWRNPLARNRIDSMPLRVMAGVKGYVTKKVALIVKGGYGQGFYQAGPDIQTFVGEAGVGFKFTDFTLLELGYDRDFTDSFYAGWYVGDSAYLRFGQQLFQRVNLELGARYTYVQYSSFSPQVETPAAGITANQEDRRDHGLRATAAVSWSIARWVAFRVGYQFDGVFTDFQIDYTAGGQPFTDYGGFVAHQVFGELSLLY
jgi:hypothetical protein